jgi:stage V sporulation protein B
MRTADNEGDRLSRGAAGGTLGTGIGALAGLVFIVYIFYLSYPGIKSEFGGGRQKSYEGAGEITKEIFSTAIPIILGTAVFSITNLIDTSMIMSRLMNGAHFTEATATALFGQLSTKYVTLTTLPISISAAFATASIPSIAASNVLRDRKEVKKKINMVLRITMILSIPSAVGMGILSTQILWLLFPAYPDGADLLRIGSISIIFLSLTQITTGILQAVGKVKIPVLAALIGALVKIPINYILLGITSVNIKGAVISTIVFYIVTSYIDWTQLSKAVRMEPDFSGIIIKPLVASGVMGLMVYVTYYLSYYAFNRNWLSVFFSIFCGLITYFVVLIQIRGLKKRDLNQISFARRLSKYIK